MGQVKGWFGEKKTQFGLFLFLSSKTYKRFHDVVVPTDNGTTQIDHLIVSRYGLFVIETKDYSGWIFGSEKQAKWTQQFRRKKFHFQNPIHQNYRHQKCLSEYLDLEMSKIHPFVWFTGDAEFKTQMPKNVMKSGLIPYIKGFRNTIIAEEEELDIIDKVGSLEIDMSLNHSVHMHSLKQRYESTTNCPKCGSLLVEKVAKQGKHARERFLGCTSYPRCRYIKNNI